MECEIHNLRKVCGETRRNLTFGNKLQQMPQIITIETKPIEW